MQHRHVSDHAPHDATLIAGHAAGDLTDVERARADALLAECAHCAELRRDLVAIAAATRSVPAPATLARDLRLAPEQADRLRRGSWLRGFLRPFGATGSPLRPVATALTSLGVIGLVVGITMSSALPQAGGFASGQGLQREGAAAPAAPPTNAAIEAAGNGYEIHSPGVPLAVSSDRAQAQNATVPPGRTAMDAARSKAPASSTPPTSAAFGAADQGGEPEDRDEATVALAAAPLPSALIAGSLALLGIGLLLFGLRIASRRVR